MKHKRLNAYHGIELIATNFVLTFYVINIDCHVDPGYGEMLFHND